MENFLIKKNCIQELHSTAVVTLSDIIEHLSKVITAKTDRTLAHWKSTILSTENNQIDGIFKNYQ